MERVNLFIGKNNTGKSTILEALALYVSQEDAKLINQVSGKVIRLVMKNGIIKEVEFNADELKIVTDQDTILR